MTADDALVTKARTVLQLSGYSDLTEKLGEYFPHSGMSWLTDDSDRAFAEAFTSGSGGWLTSAQDSEFWGLIEGASETGTDDSLARWLQGLIGQWGAPGSGAEAAEPDAGPLGANPAPRFDEEKIAPVGDGYPGWWQGYDYLDGAWKYLRSDTKPTGQSSGWLPSDAAFAQMQAGVQPPPAQPPPTQPPATQAPAASQPDTKLDSSMVKLLADMMAAARQDSLADFFGVEDEESKSAEK
jgi:hypothetical protein